MKSKTMRLVDAFALALKDNAALSAPKAKGNAKANQYVTPEESR
jgi:hypothetical protein